MVLSRLVLNPDCPAARRDLSNRYEMHRTLSRLGAGNADRLLWRLEADHGPAPSVLVQTDEAPDAQALHATAPDYFLSFESRHNRLLDNVREGDRLRFKVLANPTVKREGKRHGLFRAEDQEAWIERQLVRHGATPLAMRIGETFTERCWRGKDRRPITVFGVAYEGLMVVDDARLVRELVAKGLGHAKALGFGLVTLGR